MEVIEEKVNHKFKYSYWIFLLTGIALISCVWYFTGRDSMTGLYDYSKIVKSEAVMFISSSIAWAIARQYRLNYVLICLLAGFCYVAVLCMSDFILHLIFAGTFSIGVQLLPVIPLIFFAALFLGGLLLVISYPFQYLYLRLKNHQEFKVIS